MRLHLLKTLARICLMFVLLLTGELYAQVTSSGRDFWFNFMHQHETSGRVYDLKIFISSDVNSSGTVDVPGKGWSQNFSVTANSTTTITVPTDVGHVTIADAIANQAIHVVADNDINVFALNYSINTTDGSLILPSTALGNDYFILTYQPLSSAERSEFSIVAIEDNTTVRIIPSQNTSGGHPANTAYDVTISQGQVYQVESTGDLTGSRVRVIGSTKKIAVFGGATCVNIPNAYGACDHLFEQMFPNNTLRRNFVAIPYKTRTKGDTYRALATRNGTIITFDGGSPMNLNAGDWQEFQLGAPTYISSNYPVSIAQYSNGTMYDGVTAADPFFIILSPVEQTREDITFEVFNFPNITGNYLNVAAKTTCTADVVLDGAQVTGWATVPGNTNYSYVQLSVAQGPHRLVSSKDCGFNAYVYGYGNADSYGYSAGVRLDTLAVSMTVNTDCANKGTSYFVSSYPYPITNYFWDFGDGNSSTDDNPVHVYTNGGNFVVKLYVTYDNGDKDTVITQFTIIEPVAKGEFNGGMCVNDLITFTNKSSVIGGGVITQYNWDFGDGTNSASANTSHSYLASGTYKVVLTVTTANTCIDRDTLTVIINPLPQPRITPAGPIDICTCDSIELDAGNLGYVSYLWSTGQTSQKITVKATGTYNVSVIDTNGCTNSSPGVIVNVIQPQATITLGKPVYGVEPGDTVSVPIYISQSAYLDFCNSYNWIMNLSFKKFIMVPVLSTPTGSFVSQNRVLNLTGTRNSFSDTLGVLKFMGTLGDVVSSPLTIESFDWTDCNFDVSTVNSTVELDSLCEQGGTTRLFRSPMVQASLDISPNPVTGDAEIKYTLSNESATRIFITDINAKVILELYQGFQKHGEHRLIYDSSLLSSGVYIVSVQTPDGLVTKIMEVQK